MSGAALVGSTWRDNKDKAKISETTMLMSRIVNRRFFVSSAVMMGMRMTSAVSRIVSSGMTMLGVSSELGSATES